MPTESSVMHALDLAPVIVRDLSGKVLRWTLGVERMYGFSKSEATGAITHTLLRTCFPEPLEQINATLVRCGSWSGELQHRCKDGTPIWVASTWTTHDDGGHATVIEINVDVTERKLVQGEIRKLNLDLEQRVEARTADLQEINRELDAFAFTISHDLRAPLRAMQGFSQALSEDYEDRLDPIAVDYIHRISKAASRMDALIQDLLSYSRLGRAEIRMESVDLSELVDKVLQQIDTSGAHIEVGHPLYSVRGERTVLWQVIANLVTNALKFHAPGRAARVRIWSERQGSRIRLPVEDDGIGIDARFHKQIFQVFQRLHGAEAFPGTGIGLSIVRKAIERLGGSYGLDSSEGHGSCFWFELPEVTEDGPELSDNPAGGGRRERYSSDPAGVSEGEAIQSPSGRS